MPSYCGRCKVRVYDDMLQRALRACCHHVAVTSFPGLAKQLLCVHGNGWRVARTTVSATPHLRPRVPSPLSTRVARALEKGVGQSL